MNRKLAGPAALAAAVLLLAPAARAADEGMGLARNRDDWPTELTKRPLTLGAGMTELYVPLAENLSKGADGKPFTSNPSLYFGVTDAWTIGVRHFEGLCFGGTQQGCANTYNDVSVDTIVSLGKAAGLQLALGLAVNAAPINPDVGWSGEGRVIIRAGGGALALTVAPTLNFGITDRDTRQKWAATTFNLGTYNLVTIEPQLENREVLLIPATVHVQLGHNLAVMVGASLDGPINPRTGSYGDVYRIPASAAVILTPIPWIDLGASFTVANAFGKDSTWDFRTAGVFAALRI